MIVKFTVQGVPPKKDGANSMWRKGSEASRLRALRTEASVALGSRAPTNNPLTLYVRIFAPTSAGDLDNFITGICDALMAAHPLTPVDAVLWADVPLGARPDRPIAFTDDACVWRIDVERHQPPTSGPYYEVELRWEDEKA